MAVYAIGDLQGCYDSFCRLLDKLEFDPQTDRLWLTGDLVNRGPKSLKTLRHVRKLGDCAITVLGNHDLHLLALANEIRFSNNHYDSLWKVLSADDSDELLNWLRHRPLAHFDAALNTLMVHAGVPPQWGVKETLAHAGEVGQAQCEGVVGHRSSTSARRRSSARDRRDLTVPTGTPRTAAVSASDSSSR